MSDGRAYTLAKKIASVDFNKFIDEIGLYEGFAVTVIFFHNPY